MNLKEFFTGTFFTVMIALSATILVLIYLRIFQYKLFSNLKRRLMDNKISQLKNHFIICGCGRVGHQIAEEFSREKVPFVVIDRDREKIKTCEKRGWLCLLGDSAASEEILRNAKIDTAKGLIIAIDKDADAVFVAVTAKSLNPSLFIIARASSSEVASKLEKVGVERIALPYKIGGYHMANIALRPAVVDFLDVVVDGKHQEMVVEELEIKQDASLLGKSVGNTIDYNKTNVVVLAVKKSDLSCLVHPTPDVILEKGDKIILLGAKANIELVRREHGL